MVSVSGLIDVTLPQLLCVWPACKAALSLFAFPRQLAYFHFPAPPASNMMFEQLRPKCATCRKCALWSDSCHECTEAGLNPVGACSITCAKQHARIHSYVDAFINVPKHEDAHVARLSPDSFRSTRPVGDQRQENVSVSDKVPVILFRKLHVSATNCIPLLHTCTCIY